MLRRDVKVKKFRYAVLYPKTGAKSVGIISAYNKKDAINRIRKKYLGTKITIAKYRPKNYFDLEKCPYGIIPEASIKLIEKGYRNVRNNEQNRKYYK